MTRFWLIASLLLSFCFSGCSTTDSAGVIRQYSFGFTVVALPKTASSHGDFGANEIKTLGLSLGREGITVGYAKSKGVSLPADGALYVEVTTDEQMNAVRKLIELYPQKNICTSQKTSPPRRQLSLR